VTATPAQAAADRPGAAPPVLAVRGLEVRYRTGRAELTAVRGIDLDVGRGEVLALVGESGSGKTATVLGALGLLGPAGRVVAGEVRLHGEPLDGRRRRSALGRDVGVVFQDPLTSLHPSLTVGAQLVEAIRVHAPGLGRREARRRAVELLDRVGVARAADRLDDHPHQWSGGMRQRAMIAMAIAHGPSLLIADEPTTALDVTVQAQILELLATLQSQVGMAVVLVTHDLGVVAGWADRVAVLYHGRVVEQAPVEPLFAAPAHPYTAHLLRSARAGALDGDLAAAPWRCRCCGPRTGGAVGGRPLPAHLEVTGCAFRPRCPVADDDRCPTQRPPLTASGDHAVACHHAQLPVLAP
jgi:peptide/nickel transport system ATP-binding protein